MSWTRLTSISVTNGSAIVTVNSGSTINIKVGDALLIGGFDLVEIEGVFANQLQLGSNWNHATQFNVAAAIVPTFGDFNHAVEEIRKLRQATTDNLDAMEQWCTKPEGSVVFQSYDGKQFEARSVQQMEKDVAEIEERAESMMTDINAWGFARTEADMMADRARNNQLFAASGPIHTGKHRNDVNPVYGRPIQDGLWTYLNNSNVVRLGAYPSLSSVEGNSKTYEAVFNFSGVTVHFKGLNTAYENAQLTFQQASKGTEVYDSSTGVLTNFETEIDPKYDDVAVDTHEAVERAFEGHIAIPNSDFESACYDTVIERSSVQWTTDGQAAAACRLPSYGVKAGVSYVLEFYVSCEKALSSIGFLGVGNWYSLFQHAVDIPAGLDKKTHVSVILPPPTVDLAAGAKMGLLYNTTGVRKIEGISLRAITEEVVTHPVDLVGVEFFLRPVNADDPFVYPYGMQQSKFTSVNGIPTVENTVRPITHFEVYPGDTTSRGRGWNLLDGSLSDAHAAKIFQNPEHNIYRMNDGALVQWTVSQRTIRGAGNGDWANVNPSNTSLMFSTSKLFVQARGVNDSASPLVLAGSSARYVAPNNSGNVLGGINEKGVFVPTTSVAYNGECYFYVITTVPRLNQGAYHPALNPFGASPLVNTQETSSTQQWYSSSAKKLISVKDCFYITTDYSGNVRPPQGSIGYASGRPDGKLHDVIYASGQGGVVDQRLKYGAWDASSSEQAAVVREEVKNGTYRGREQLVWSDIYESYASTSLAKSNGVFVTDTTDWAIGDVVNVVKDGDVLIKEAVIQSITTNASVAWDGARYGYYNRVSGETYLVVHTRKINTTVEGEFAQIDVLGDPANIFQIDALKEGWGGSWLPVIPDEINTWNMFSATRKKINVGNVSKLATDNNGAIWITSTHAWDDVANGPSAITIPPATRAEILTYTASAKRTEKSSNLSIFNGERGFSSVFASSNYRTANGSLLSESLFGNVLKSDSTLPRDKCYPLTGFAISSSGALEPSGNMTTHSQIDLSAPTSGDKAFKALYCQSSSNQQANLNIMANELIYSSAGGNWGDDAKLKIVADGTFTDLNGNKCKATIHKLAKPYGFIKM